MAVWEGQEAGDRWFAHVAFVGIREPLIVWGTYRAMVSAVARWRRREGGRRGIYFTGEAPVAARVLLKREVREISRISISITSGGIAPAIYKCPSLKYTRDIPMLFSVDHTGNRIVQR